MPGTILKISPKRRLDFSNLSVGETEEIVLAEGVDISQYSEIVLLVRTHSTDFSNSASRIHINVYTDGRTDQDPGLLFTAVSSAVQAIGIDTETTPVSLTLADCGPSLGALLRIAAKGSKPVSAAAISADVSVDLSMKTAVL